MFAPKQGQKYSSFNLYLPLEREDHFAEYRFEYNINPPDESLGYGEGPNNPANREFYRINKAYVTKKVGEGYEFVPVFRALQGGEIGLALREVGAGDFVGGVHGDEVFTDLSLTLDGKEIPLCGEFFESFESFEFFERSEIFRCNTPAEKIILHTQRYSVLGDTLKLYQDIEWIADGRELQKVYTPMLTAQRLDPDNNERILTDTVEFFSPEGCLVAEFDTTAYGADGGGKSWDMACEESFATSARVYGKGCNSGFSAEAGYRVLDGSIPDSQISASLCIRYMKSALDNKIYFCIAEGFAPTAGTRWSLDIYYRLSYK